jgi:hypothetical protein
MSIAGLQGRAFTDPENPEPPGISDRSNFKYLHKDLHWQYQWCGNQLVNLRLLVPEEDLDIPAEFLRPLILPPDPIPIQDPRPGWYQLQEGTTSVASPSQLIDDAYYTEDGQSYYVSEDGLFVYVGE